MCNEKLNCAVNILDNSKISQELQTTIIKKAAFLEREAKKRKINFNGKELTFKLLKKWQINF